MTGAKHASCCILLPCVCSETNDGGCVNDQQLRDFTNQFLHIPSQSLLRHGSCSSRGLESDDQCSVQKSRYAAADEQQQNFMFSVINPAFAGTMRGIRVVRQLVPHHRSTVKVGTDCSLCFSALS